MSLRCIRYPLSFAYVSSLFLWELVLYKRNVIQVLKHLKKALTKFKRGKKIMKTKIFPTWNEIYTAPKNDKLLPMLIFSTLVGAIFMGLPWLMFDGIEWFIIGFLIYFVLRMSIWLIQHLLQNKKITWY